MAIKTLYISDKKHKWNSDIPMIHSNNFEEIIKSELARDYRTSLSDIGLQNLEKIIPFAEKIELINIVEHHFDAFNELESELKYSTGRLFNELLKVRDKVNNIDILDKINFKTLNIKRHTPAPTIWTSGCSVTYGAGVSEEQTYSSLLAEKLDMPLINLARSGQSIFWAVDTLMRADIRAGDIVILGVTNIARYEYVDDWELDSHPCNNPKFLKHVDLEYFDSSTHILKSSRHILHLINFCNKIGAKVIIVNLLDPTWIPIIFNGNPNFIDLIYKVDNLIKFIDLGTDGDHPGPKQHQLYADKIFEHLAKST